MVQRGIPVVSDDHFWVFRFPLGVPILLRHNLTRTGHLGKRCNLVQAILGLDHIHLGNLSMSDALVVGLKHGKPSLIQVGHHDLTPRQNGCQFDVPTMKLLVQCLALSGSMQGGLR